MFEITLWLLAVSILLNATAAAVAIRGYVVVAGRGWAWLCLFGGFLISGMRSAVPLLVGLRIGLYDFRDALLAAISAALFLLAVLAAFSALRRRAGG